MDVATGFGTHYVHVLAWSSISIQANNTLLSQEIVVNLPAMPYPFDPPADKTSNDATSETSVRTALAIA